MVSFKTFRRSLFPKPVSWLGLFCRFLQQDGFRSKLGAFEILALKNHVVWASWMETGNELLAFNAPPGYICDAHMMLGSQTVYPKVCQNSL